MNSHENSSESTEEEGVSSESHDGMDDPFSETVKAAEFVDHFKRFLDGDSSAQLDVMRLTWSDGEITAAVEGYTALMKKLLRDERSLLDLIFDCEGSVERAVRDQRDDVLSSLRSQLPELEELSTSIRTVIIDLKQHIAEARDILRLRQLGVLEAVVSNDHHASDELLGRLPSLDVRELTSYLEALESCLVLLDTKFQEAKHERTWLRMQGNVDTHAVESVERTLKQLGEMWGPLENVVNCFRQEVSRRAL